MKHIIKSTTPKLFEQWVNDNLHTINTKIANNESGDAIWALLNSSLPPNEYQEPHKNYYSKENLRTALITEQGYICCYCIQRIKDAPLHAKIEHFLPKDSYKANTFDYQNLHLACMGGERDAPPRYCDTYKGNQPTTIISPLQPNCQEHFTYTEQGNIKPNNNHNIDKELAKTTIETLNLNAPALKLLREKTIDTYIYEVWTPDMDTQKEITDLLSINTEGMYEPFCVAIAQVLSYYP